MLMRVINNVQTTASKCFVACLVLIQTRPTNMMKDHTQCAQKRFQFQLSLIMTLLFFDVSF